MKCVLLAAAGAATSLWAQRVPPQPSNVVLSGDGARLAFVLEDSLLVTDRSGRIVRVASGVGGEASSPFPFLAWSPNGRLLIARTGQGMGMGIGEPVLVDVDARAVTPLLPDSLRGSMATFQTFLGGGPSWSPDNRRVAFLGLDRRNPATSMQVFVADVGARTLTRVTAPGLTRFSVAWSPDGRWLAYSSGAFNSRVGTVEIVPASNLSAPPILVYRDSTGLLRDLAWSPDGARLLVQDRPRRTFVVAIDSTGRAQTVPHSLGREKIAGWLSSDEVVVTRPSGMSPRVAIVNLDGRSTFVSGVDTSAAAVGVAAGAIAMTMNSGSMPLDAWLVRMNANGQAERTRLTRFADAFTGLPTSSIVRWRSSLGDTVEAQLLAPRNARRPMPTIVVPYGSYTNTFPKSDYFLELGYLDLLAQGYAILHPNTHGTSSDDKDRGRYGELQLADTRLLLDTLARTGVVDARRVAVMGHSHGGAMAYYYATHAPIWCAAIAVNGRADWFLQGRYENDGVLPAALGGSPDSLPARYAEFSPASNARKMTAPLLAVAGMKDTQILPRNVAIMRDSMSAAGKEIHTLEFQDEGHLILNESNQRRFWTEAKDLLAHNCR